MHEQIRTTYDEGPGREPGPFALQAHEVEHLGDTALRDACGGGECRQVIAGRAARMDALRVEQRPDLAQRRSVLLAGGSCARPIIRITPAPVVVSAQAIAATAAAVAASSATSIDAGHPLQRHPSRRSAEGTCGPVAHAATAVPVAGATTTELGCFGRAATRVRRLCHGLDELLRRCASGRWISQAWLERGARRGRGALPSAVAR